MARYRKEMTGSLDDEQIRISADIDLQFYLFEGAVRNHGSTTIQKLKARLAREKNGL